MGFSWVTLNVVDMEESLKFYQEVVGLNISSRFHAGTNMEIVFLGDGETKVELIYDANKKSVQMGQDISIGFSVDSLDDMMELIKEKNINIHSGPFQPNPNTRFFFVMDPNGLRVQFIGQY